jgi:hypothetical protein
MSKVLICGGISSQTGKSCEILDLESPSTTCKVIPNLLVPIFAAIGGLKFNGNPVICGGQQISMYSENCYSLENNGWFSSHNMSSARGYGAATQLKNGQLLVTGGHNNTFFINDSEMTKAEGWESKIPLLPVTIGYHCTVTINSTTVMAIGGYQNDKLAGNTFYFTFGGKNWSVGPALKYPRYMLSCGRIMTDPTNQQMSVLVAGGSNGLRESMSSVEILDEGTSEWRNGPGLPFPISYSQMVEDQYGGVVLIGGVVSTLGRLDMLYHLPHAGIDAKWSEMEQKLKTGRYFHSAFLVPDNIAGCS